MRARGGRWQSVLRYLAIAICVVTAGTWALDRFVLAPPTLMSPLTDVERVEVSACQDRRECPVRQVTDPEAVARLPAFADGLRSGWRGTWHTMPKPPVSACYFRGDELRHRVSAGREIPTARSAEHHGLQPATAEQTRRFAVLAGVPDTTLDRG